VRSNTRRTIGVPYAVRSVLVSLLVASTANAQSTGERVIPIKNVPTFKNPMPSLQAYVQQYSKARGPQHFCVVAYRATDGDQWAYVFWREGHQLILWNEVTDPKDATHALLYSRRVWDLDTDVVATPAEIHYSTYLIDRPWVRKVSDACDRGGTSLVLVRK